MNNTVKHFYIKKWSGFFNNVTISDFDGIRTLEIIDKEVGMSNMEPRDTIILTFNKDDENNVDQMRDLANTILEMIGDKDNK